MPETPPGLTPAERALWLAVRQGLLLIAGAIERFLGLPARR